MTREKKAAGGEGRREKGEGWRREKAKEEEAGGKAMREWMALVALISRV